MVTQWGWTILSSNDGYVFHSLNPSKHGDWLNNIETSEDLKCIVSRTTFVFWGTSGLGLGISRLMLSVMIWFDWHGCKWKSNLVARQHMNMTCSQKAGFGAQKVTRVDSHRVFIRTSWVRDQHVGGYLKWSILGSLRWRHMLHELWLCNIFRLYAQ